MSFQDYILALQSGDYIQKIKIELLNPDETPREEITSLIINTNGNLNVQRANGTRRTVVFDIMNLDNTYIPNPDNFYIHQKFIVYLGLELPDGTDYWITQGVFILNDPITSSLFSESLITINGIDKFGLIDGSLGGELGYVYQIPLGTDVSQAIRDTLALSNDPQVPIIDTFLIGKTVPYTMIYQPSDNLGKILVDLAQLYSCSIYYNTIGQLVIERDIDDSIKPSIWDYSVDEFAYQGSKNTYKWSEMYNSVLVVGSNISGTSVSYKTQNLNLLSPTSIPNLNNWERIFYYQSDTLSTIQQCDDLSAYILKRKTAQQNEIQITSVPIYHLDADNICTITDPKLGLNQERFLINNFSLQLNVGGQLTVNVVKSKEIPFI